MVERGQSVDSLIVIVLLRSLWVKDLTELAKQEPQLAYSAFTFGLFKRWIYLMRTTPNISQLFLPLESAIRNEFLPTIIGQPFIDDLRNIFALPAKYGGLGIFNPTEITDDEYNYSRMITSPFIHAIKYQEWQFFSTLKHIWTLLIKYQVKLKP